jgi:transposase
MNEGKKLPRYSRDYKIMAVKKVVEENKKASEVARELGLCYQTLTSWIKSFQANGEHSFPGKGQLHTPDRELNEARRQIRLLTMERDLLKKTMGFFVERPS